MPSLDDVFQELSTIAAEFPDATYARKRELQHRRRELHAQAEVWDTAARRGKMTAELERLRAQLEELESSLITISAKRQGFRGMIWGEYNWQNDAVKLNDHIRQDHDAGGLEERITTLERKLGLKN